jgi:gamma-glutamyl:cysteine ligase YbdK (ATP-grasp superfamily)
MDSYHLFERHGVEMEYMIVDAATLDVRPVADMILARATGETEASDAEFGRMSWSNELVRHVLEFKTTAPEPSLDGLEAFFQAEVVRANSLLKSNGMRLLPTGMHPWMNPLSETVLWPFGNKEIYNAFDRIFNCKGHGWSNLQSTHINLPFHGDEEFHRLHAAIRIVLPLIPAISASTPYADGAAAPALDMRLEVYRHNCDRVPSITAGVVPGVIASKAEYEERILGEIYSDLAPLDPDGILCDEWVNARGAIARFERDTIEIRVIDLQECPKADMAIVQYVTALVKALVDGKFASLETQDEAVQKDLEGAFLACMRDAGGAKLRAPSLLEAFGMNPVREIEARELHARLLDAVAPADAWWKPVVADILNHGTLAERIKRAVGPSVSRRKLREVYGRLADCLARGEVFVA